MRKLLTKVCSRASEGGLRHVSSAFRQPCFDESLQPEVVGFSITYFFSLFFRQYISTTVWFSPKNGPKEGRTVRALTNDESAGSRGNGQS